VTLWICALGVGLAALSASAAPAETQVFLVEGTVSPASVQEGAVLSEGSQLRTGGESFVVLVEQWPVGEGSECHLWTIVGSRQTHRVQSAAGARCPETGNADRALDAALTRRDATSRVVFKVLAQAGEGKGDSFRTESESDRFAAQLRRRAPTERSRGPRRPALPRGVYTIQQRSNGRYVDAHVTLDRDFLVVTREAQNNDTQRWLLTPVGGNAYTIQQKSNGRYVDAHVTPDRDFELVTRESQKNDTQRWIMTPLGGDVYTIQQKSNRRYVDAHVTPDRDFALVTRESQKNDTQRWVIRRD
jgi:hypothetical protein